MTTNPDICPDCGAHSCVCPEDYVHPEVAAERAAKLRRFESLKQIRLGQTGGRAAATQRKIEALARELQQAGVL